MKLTLSISQESDTFSTFRKQFCSSPEKTLNPLLLPHPTQKSSLNNFPVSDLKPKQPEFSFGMKNPEKNCLKKHEKIELELKRFPEEKIEDESMLAFRGHLNLNHPQDKKIHITKETFELGENLNSESQNKDLVFKQLKQLDFDEEDLKKKNTQQKEKQFERFFKNVSTKSGNSQTKTSTKFNFGVMNQKISLGFHAPVGRSQLSDNFGFQIFEHLHKDKQNEFRSSLKQAINRENHVDLKKMSKKNSSIKDKFKNFLRMRNQKMGVQTLGKERKSLQSTGLRRKDVIFSEARVDENLLRPMTPFELTSFLNQTPKLTRRKNRVFEYLNQKSMRNLWTDKKERTAKKDFRQSRTSIRKRTQLNWSGDQFNQLFQNLGTPELTKRSFDFFNESTQEKLSKLESRNTIGTSPDLNKPESPNQMKSESDKKLKKLLSSIKKKSGNSASKSKKKCGCKCKKTKCTRLHCVCFRERGFCGDECGCTGCLNREEFSETIKKIKDFTKEINPLAFQSKIQMIGLENGQRIHNRGCSCQKNQCQKNYCECHKNGLSCSPLCKCEDCKNEKVDIEINKVKEIFKKCSRKKKKFVIFLNKEKPTIKKIQI